MELRPRRGRPVETPSTPSEVVKPSPKPRPPSSRRRTSLPIPSDGNPEKPSSETAFRTQEDDIPQGTQATKTYHRRVRNSARKSISHVESLPAGSVMDTTPLSSVPPIPASRTTNKSKTLKSNKRNSKEKCERGRVLFPDNDDPSEVTDSVSIVHSTPVRKQNGNGQSDKCPDNRQDENIELLLVNEDAMHGNTEKVHLILDNIACMNVDGKPLDQEQLDDQNVDRMLITNNDHKENSIGEYKEDVADSTNTYGSNAIKTIGGMSNGNKITCEGKNDIGCPSLISQVSDISEETKQMQKKSDLDGVDKDCSSEDFNDDSDADDVELAKLFVKSLKTYMQQSDCSLTKAEKNQDTLEDENRFSGTMEISSSQLANRNVSRSTDLDPVWSPNVELSSSKDIRSRNSKNNSNVMPKSIWQKESQLQDGLVVPPIDPSKFKKLAKKQKDDTAGSKWFNLPAPTITPELKKELQLLKLRGVVDPKRHYKADDSKGLPKYFEVGTVVGGPTDFFSGRLTKKERKSSLADELLSDYSLSSYRKRKYLEIQDQKQAGGKSFWKAKTKKQTPAWARI